MGPGGQGGRIRVITPRRFPATARPQDGLAAAIQHSASILPSQCGSPLLGLDGKALGLNIAPGYGLPARVVAREIRKLAKTGNAGDGNE